MTSRIEQVIREIQQLREFYNKTESKSDISDENSDKSADMVKETPKTPFK